MAGDPDVRIPGRIEAVRPERSRVRLAVDNGDRLEVADPDGTIPPALEGELRTVEATVTDCEALAVADRRETGFYRGDAGIDVVGTVRGDRASAESAGSVSTWLSRQRAVVDVPLDPRVVGKLPEALFDGETLAVARDVTVRPVGTCLRPLTNPFFPPVLRDVVVELSEGDEQGTSFDRQPVDPIDPTGVHRPVDLLTEDEVSHLRVPGRDRLDSLDAALVDLFDRSDATLSLAPTSRVTLRVVREGVRYYGKEVVRISLTPNQGETEHGYVVFVQLCIAVANARYRLAGRLPRRGVTLALLRRGLTFFDESTGAFLRPRDPYENYVGVLQGYALSRGDDPLSDDVGEYEREELQSWAAFDRVYDGEGIVDAYHRYG